MLINQCYPVKCGNVAFSDMSDVAELFKISDALLAGICICACWHSMPYGLSLTREKQRNKYVFFFSKLFFGHL